MISTCICLKYLYLVCRARQANSAGANFSVAVGVSEKALFSPEHAFVAQLAVASVITLTCMLICALRDIRKYQQLNFLH